MKIELDEDRFHLDDVDCAKIVLQDLEIENLKIEIFCITDDKYYPDGLSLHLLMKTLRKKYNEFL